MLFKLVLKKLSNKSKISKIIWRKLMKIQLKMLKKTIRLSLDNKEQIFFKTMKDPSSTNDSFQTR